MYKYCFIFYFLLTSFLAACSSSDHLRSTSHVNLSKGQLHDQIMALMILIEQQQDWAGTPYQLGGLSRSGIDCSGFVQKTFADRFNIALPRTTKAQANIGQRVAKSEIQTGDLVFFKTGRGPFGYHVGIYVKDNQFLHASTKGGVIYSSMNSPFWQKSFWQARRL